ncbi:putative tetratricopeptide-like helical domain-containing protein [Medicago truncatula]|uniref:Putative tetratricopeptide-like helical domain-containing protein n=1 Tax=Medicago truncatula TaxID=3880 RepID=A0A072U4B1_MEDTR|nr:protein NPGR2 [Medicago truncatula]XP_024626357.1 protein NPGR2 [Medicago truncatula]XP_039683312.1 protein NPGR2 [Medicago truncatula]KEH23953.1 TPR 7B-like protein [Medicago truncatula]RHN48235.1 putative tetratricopeptide-like helical domain-containing protein [Medicago truncatula]
MGSRDKHRGKRLQKIMKCFCSGDMVKEEETMVPNSSESLATKDYFSSTASGISGQDGQVERRLDSGNIEQAESSLRESGILNYEEARALLGRYEYQEGNIEAALHVFEGINIAALTPKIKVFLAKSTERPKRRSQNYTTPPMSIHTAGLLLEAIFLKAKCLQVLARFEESAQTCKIILDLIESSLPEGLPGNFGSECKLQETLSKAVELLPELWKLADCPREVILSYRNALLHRWNLDAGTTAKIQKEFAIFLLYSGGEEIPSDLRSHMDSSFVPRNNIEEAILLLMILQRKIALNKIESDPSIMEHLSFSLSVSGDLTALANQWEELLPVTINRRERYHALALCYYGANKDLVALNLLKKLLSSSEDPKHVPALLMASKICCENPDLAKDGVSYACRARENLFEKCNQLESLANCLLGVSLSTYSKFAVSNSERFERQSEALHSLETASTMTKMKEPLILYYLSLECAEQRKLDSALCYAERFLSLEAGSNIRGWLLLARILSAQKQFLDAEGIVDAALDRTGIWDQGDLLRTKAKLQIAQEKLPSAIETYTQLLGILLVQRKTFGSRTKLYKDNRDHARNLEVEIWHDLAYIYIRLSRWHDAEACLSKSKAIKLHSASRCHVIGTMLEAKGLYKEALKAFRDALDLDPGHIPSLISTAVVLRRDGTQSNPAIRSYLMEALRLNSSNASAWYHLGILHKAEGRMSEAAECFQEANSLEESEPVEPFR